MTNSYLIEQNKLAKPYTSLKQRICIGGKLACILYSINAYIHFLTFIYIIKIEKWIYNILMRLQFNGYNLGISKNQRTKFEFQSGRYPHLRKNTVRKGIYSSLIPQLGVEQHDKIASLVLLGHHSIYQRNLLREKIFRKRHDRLLND